MQFDGGTVVERDVGLGVVEVFVEASLGQVIVVLAHVLGVLDEGGCDADRLQLDREGCGIEGCSPGRDLGVELVFVSAPAE